jgi:1,4-alpha-glucan branching enzyme
LHVHHIANQDKVNVYHRWETGGPRDDVVVTANLAHRGLSFYKVGPPGGGVWRIRFNSD